MMLPTRVLYYGVDRPLPEQIPLVAGPLSLIFEAGDLRYIRLGDREIVRRIYVAVRDHNWGTAPTVIENLAMDIADDHFAIAYDVVNRMADIDFAWHGTITGGTDGTIHFGTDGVARSTFKRNRLGFCVLHPLTCAGAAAQIEHVDGSTDTNPFPVAIAPQLVVNGIIKPVHPFDEMAAVSHEVLPGLWAELRFEGEIFEMEDQRNWTDASYKTYCTPLRLLFPVEVAAGSRVHQAVNLRLRGDTPPVTVGNAAAATITISGGAPKPLPRLGLGMASHGQPLSAQEIARLAGLHLAHLRVDLGLSQLDWEAKLTAAATTAAALGVRLEVAVHLSVAAETELAGLARAVTALNAPVGAWLIFQAGAKCTPRSAAELARRVLGGLVPAAAIGGGTDIFFTELNSSPPAFDALDLVCYSLNPQVHAFDNASLTETLACQGITVASARRLAGDRPLAVTPVTLRMRFNPNATGPEPASAPGELPPQVDPRQMSLYGAGWTVGSLKYLAENGVQSVTYYETTGWRGVMETAAGSPLPDKFASLPGAVFPLYHVLADVGEFAGGEVVPTAASRPLQVDALTLARGSARRTLVANLSAETQAVTVAGLASVVRVSVLDETVALQAMTKPETFRVASGHEQQAAGGALSLSLRPYAIGRVDWTAL